MWRDFNTGEKNPTSEQLPESNSPVVRRVLKNKESDQIIHVAWFFVIATIKDFKDYLHLKLNLLIKESSVSVGAIFRE